MNIWIHALDNWMPLVGLMLGPLLARWIQLTPLWMHTKWGDFDMGTGPLRPPWSLNGSCFMAAITGLIWGACAHIWAGPTAVAWAVFASGLWLLACVDALSGWLPNVFTLGLMTLGFLAGLAHITSTELVDAMGGAVLGYSILWASARGFHRWTGREGLGGGDPKLLAAIGAWLGWSSVAPVLLVASVSGLFVGGIMQTIGRWPAHQPFSFGPFLALAVPIVTLWGPDAFSVFLSP